MLFRLGIASQLISHIFFIFVALALYDLLKGVNQRHASLMVTWVVVSVPIAFLNELNAIAALFLVRGADFLSIFEKPQRLWLYSPLICILKDWVSSQYFGVFAPFPRAACVPVGFLPRVLGVLLMVNCFAYPPVLLPYFCHITKPSSPDR
jgi:hypothetical protein